MLKGALESGIVRTELRCERSNAFDLNKKHQDVSKIFYSESIFLHVLFQSDQIDLREVQSRIHITLENVSIEKIVPHGSLKTGSSLMKMKSVDSLSEHMSQLTLSSPIVNGSELSPVNCVKTIFVDKDLVVFCLPLHIPDLEDDDIIEDGPSLLKRVKLLLAVYEKAVKEPDLSSLLELSRPFGSGHLERFLLKNCETAGHTLHQMCHIEKSLEIVNPLHVTLETLRMGKERKVAIVMDISTTEHVEDKIWIHSISSRLRMLRASLPSVTITPMASMAYPISLENREVLTVGYTIDETFESNYEYETLYLNTEIEGMYADRPTRFTLEIPLTIPHEIDNLSSISLQCHDSPVVILGEPFTVEFKVRNGLSSPEDLVAHFTLAGRSEAVISLDPEIPLGELRPGYSRYFAAKMIAIDTGDHRFDDVYVEDSSGRQYRLDKPIRLFVKR